MTQSFRLPEGGLIERGQPRGFRFDGRDYQGYAGDSLASALLANGVHLVARSFKYHRPRGISAAGYEETNALVQLGHDPRTDPNQLATLVELSDGLEARSQNRWPSLDFDVNVINGVFSRLMPSGFYYKTFKWPAALWMHYEHVIRHAAGMGLAPRERDPDRYDQTNAHCDVLVVGAGPAGLSAALAAARTGARVILAEQDRRLGGALLGRPGETIDAAPALDWVRDAEAELRETPEVRLLSRTSAYAYFDHNFLGLIERVTDHLVEKPDELPRQRLWKVRAKQVVLATGAIERPLVFSDNDRPGTMLAGACQTYVNRYAVKPGSKAVVFTNNDGAYGAALDMAAAGIEIAAVVDLRSQPDGPMTERAEAAGLSILADHAIVATEGDKRVRRVRVAPLSEEGNRVFGPGEAIDCDLVAVSGGWNPTVHLMSQSTGKIGWNEELGCFVPGESAQAARSAGTCNGTFGLASCLAEGAAAGGGPGGGRPGRLQDQGPQEGRTQGRGPRLPAGPLDVDRALRPAAGPRRQALHRPPERRDRRRPQAGAARGLPLHRASQALYDDRHGHRPGQDVERERHRPRGRRDGPRGPRGRGDDLPAALHPRDLRGLRRARRGRPAGPGAAHAHARLARAGRRALRGRGPVEARLVLPQGRRGHSRRRAAIQGTDTAEFLNRIYTNAWLKLEVGKCRYGLMLGEDGMVKDDGVTARLGEHHFLMTTTTGNAAPVLAHLEEYLQTEWPELDVRCTSVTEQFATISIAGPNSRRLLDELTEDIELSPNDFAHMTLKEGHVAGIPARVFRVSFTGESAFEINVPASYGLTLWQTLMAAGEKYGITPYGTEAMHVLRAEKGFIIVGQETDGSTNPLDLGMDWIVSKKKDFVGRRSLYRSDMAKTDRKQLVGIVTDDPNAVLPEGAQLVEPDKARPAPPMPMVGHVSSSYMSPNVGRSIALALVKGGRERRGQSLVAPLLDGRRVNCSITDPVFFDPEGERLRG
jgi:sarcosine oxidase subunit alpha